MSKLTDFKGSGGGFKPFNDLGTVTGVVNLDVSEFGSFRVKQGAGDITLNVTGTAVDDAGYVELFFYRDFNWGVSITGADLVDNGYVDVPGDITSLDYGNVSFYVGGEDIGTRGITFNNDGSKMYMVGFANDSIYQYTLSTPFDLSTASYDSVSFSVAAQDSTPFGIVFNNDGSKMYTTGSDSMYQYTLSTPFDLSTASYDSVSFYVNGEDSNSYDFAFNSSGSNMYMVGESNQAVYQYTLSTAFDLSTASYDSVSFDVSGENSSPNSIVFNNNGSKMYMTEGYSDSVYQYTLSTPFDLSTASYDSVSFDVSGEVTQTLSIAFNNRGSKIYILNGANHSVYEYNASYDFGPHFVYQIIHIGTTTPTFKTFESEYSIEVAT
jgi:sugar lactone lactonase YvrE